MNKLFKSRRGFTWSDFPYNTLVTQFKDGATVVFYYDNSLIIGFDHTSISNELRKQAIDYLNANYADLWRYATITLAKSPKIEDQIALETLYSD